MTRENWALDAIEREAMRRAQRARLWPMTFYYMGVSEDRLVWLIEDYHHRTGKPARDLDPKVPHE